MLASSAPVVSPTAFIIEQVSGPRTFRAPSAFVRTVHISYGDSAYLEGLAVSLYGFFGHTDGPTAP